MTGVPVKEAVGLPICDVFRFSGGDADFRFSPEGTDRRSREEDLDFTSVVRS